MGNVESTEQISPEGFLEIEKLENEYYESHSIDKYQVTRNDMQNFFFNFIINPNSQSEEFKQFCDFSSEASKRSFQTSECFLFPMERKTEYELDVNNEDKILSRRIFENKKGFDEQEIAGLKSLYRQIARHNYLNADNQLKFPYYWRVSETLKFLQASKFDNKTTIENLKNHLEFRNTYFPMTISSNVIEILTKTGFLYVHGRDRFCRPIIVCRAQGYISNLKKFSYDDFLGAIVFFIEYLINFLMVPGQIECWNIINDLNGVSLLTLPSDFHKFLKFLQVNYRCRLNISYVFGMNKVFDYLWRVIKTFLDKNVEKKIVFVNDSNKEKILDLVLPVQIEKRYGGTSPNLFNEDGSLLNKNSNLFPLNMPVFDNLNEKDKKKLFNENDYINLIKEGKITAVSPYVQIES